ncbi:MAG: YqgE/AlgH family protein [Defluviicoccus sp.]|nr:YqgE/AlgH family protein [Defluviicoccus sp.]
MTGRLRRAIILIVAVISLSAFQKAVAQSNLLPDSLQGWFLVAAPDMPDPRFAGTVIYMIRHGPDGAMGFVINRVLAEDWAGNILDPGSAPAERSGRKIAVHYGGPVGATEGFILHSDDFSGGNSVKVAEGVWLSADAEILREMARGEGPARGLFVLGYSGWAPGQLESELARDDWVIAPGDTGLLFDPDLANKWRRAWDNRGVRL